MRSRAVVIGASFAGMLAAAAAAAQAGYQVMVLERDALPEGTERRAGVPQGEQAHILLHRGLTAIQSLLPGIEEDLIAYGKPFTPGWSRGWASGAGYRSSHGPTRSSRSAARCWR